MIVTRPLATAGLVLLLASGLWACDRAPDPAEPAPAVRPPTSIAVEPQAPAPAPAPASPAPGVTPPPATPPAPAPAPAQSPALWEVSRTRQGAAATLSRQDRVLLTITCTANPPRLRVHVPGFRPVASEDRVSIGFDDDPITLAANLNARGQGVTARGEPPANIGARILRARSIRVNYGNQNAGPFDAPRGEDAATLASGCAGAVAPPAGPPPGTGPEPETPQRQSIPANFRGEWNSRLQDCGTSRNDSRLIIEARRLRFHESSGQVTAVERNGQRSITVEARYTGEGETWNRATRMTLSRAGDQLTIDGMTRQRCPAGDSPRRESGR